VSEESKERQCPECGASLMRDGTCLRCAPPVVFNPEWLEPPGGRDIVPLQEHEKADR
jgi:hypothetical protein